MSQFNQPLWNGNGGGTSGGGAPVSARTLIYDAYRSLGVLRPGQGASVEGIDDAFRLLNDMVDAWNLERLMIFCEQRNTYPLTPGVSCYTIGPSGCLPGDRPLRLTSASVVLSSSCACGPLVPAAGCNDGSAGIYYEPTWPDGTIVIKPPPSAGSSLAIASWQQLSGFADLSTLYGFPPGYALALRWNLAWEMAPLALIMRKIPDALLANIQERATSAKAAIKSFNSSPPPVLDASDGGALGCCGGYDICSDSYGQVSAVPPLVISGPPGPAGPAGAAGAAGPSLDYAGIVERNGTMHAPAGWTISHPSTGVYTITHNLNLDPVGHAVTISSARGTLDPIDPGKIASLVGSVRDQQANFFTVAMVQGEPSGLSFVDAGFNFSLSLGAR